MATSPCVNCGDDLANQWKIAAPLPRVPIGRFIVPLVRKNAMVQEMNPGEVIPAHFLDIAGIAAAIAALPPAPPAPPPAP